MTSNVEATAAEIEQMRVGEISPGLAQLALTLAASVDERSGPTAKANAARELRAVMESLRKLAPVAEEDDKVDQLAQKREERRVRARRA
ncbi:hypothetical protein ACJ6WF_16065 [Streptomyces sp. MMS24-I2-30]|uniref:hypothetical protein n=1 Tax=Streptomyces sp. MMS24-I2-30 TaxID=3351564 RepID=UPI003896A074